MMIQKPERIRAPNHLAFLRTLPCSVPGCRGTPIEAHHLTHAQPKARGLKAGDQWAVPLCRRHHCPSSGASVHFRGDERAWWQGVGVDPVALAERLWATSHGAGAR